MNDIVQALKEACCVALLLALPIAAIWGIAICMVLLQRALGL